MAADGPEPKRHFILDNTAHPEPFRPAGGGGGQNAVPRRNRKRHGLDLLQQLSDLKPAIEQARTQQEAMGAEEGFGLQIEFESFPDIELAFESLAAESSGIELLNVRHDGPRTFATVSVPDGKLHILENKIVAYLDERNDSINEKKGTSTPRNPKLLDAIHSIRVASIRSLWSDDPEVFPTDAEEAFWWEVWLPVGSGDRLRAIEQFRRLAEGLDFRTARGQIEFPERTVLLIYGSVEQMQRSIMALNSIAELRRAKETADFFDSLPPAEQPEWASELLQRITVADAGAAVPHVCLLDTGVNNGHPLLAPAIASQDAHTVEPGWGTGDKEGHGTEMAGLALLGNLTTALDSTRSIEVFHRLESVKLLDRNHSNSGEPDHHGYLTVEAVSRPEIIAAQRSRVFSMAVTARDARDRGRPSAWSATIDRLAVDYDNLGETPRLFVLSAGNIEDPNSWAEYPASNSTDGIHDP